MVVGAQTFEARAAELVERWEDDLTLPWRTFADWVKTIDAPFARLTAERLLTLEDVHASPTTARHWLAGVEIKRPKSKPQPKPQRKPKVVVHRPIKKTKTKHAPSRRPAADAQIKIAA